MIYTGTERQAINDWGQIAFHAAFSDGTQGVFISNAVASLPQATQLITAIIPEPGLPLLSWSAAVCAFVFGWQRVR
jgi:hypothetical protein